MIFWCVNNAERAEWRADQGGGILGVVCGGAGGPSGRGRRLGAVRHQAERQHLGHHPAERPGHEGVSV